MPTLRPLSVITRFRTARDSVTLGAVAQIEIHGVLAESGTMPCEDEMLVSLRPVVTERDLGAVVDEPCGFAAREIYERTGIGQITRYRQRTTGGRICRPDTETAAAEEGRCCCRTVLLDCERWSDAGRNIGREQAPPD